MAAAGDKPTAAEWNLMRPLKAVKSGDESRTSTIAVSDDSELVLTVAANTLYYVKGVLLYDGASGGDLRLGWSAPAGATFDWTGGGLDSASTGLAGTMYVGAWTLAGEHVYGCNASGNNQFALPEGWLQTGANAGSFRARWAQGTSSATSTRIRARSGLTALAMP
jgi:hypothetical protein